MISAPELMTSEDEAHEKSKLVGSYNDYMSSDMRPIFIWPPFDVSQKEYRHNKKYMCIPAWMVKWVVPTLLAGLGFFLQNWQLRIGTYYYVHVMVQHELDMEETHNKYQSADNIPLTIGLTSKNVSFGALEDPVVAAMGGYQHISITVLDAISLLFPLLFVSITFAVDNVFVWTKIMICFSVLAFFKGFFAWITIVPDSNGWPVCKARLAASKYSVDWFMKEHTPWSLLLMDPRSRLCADMMYSGHTYFVALFALGLHEITRLALRTVNAPLRIVLENSIVVAAIIQQSVEIYFVLKSRFHYTSDVAMALLLTYLFYTNIAIATLAGWWVNLDEAELRDYQVAQAESRHVDKDSIAKNSYINAFSRPNAMTSLGCCWCSWAQQYTYSRRRLFHIMNKVQESENSLIKIIHQPQQHRLEHVTTKMDKNAKVRIREELGMLHARSVHAWTDEEHDELAKELEDLDVNTTPRGEPRSKGFFGAFKRLFRWNH